MLPFGHTSAGYLISQIGRGKLKWYEVLLIMFSANIFDFDFFIPPIMGFPGGTHHLFPTHTPLAGVIYFGILWIILRKRISVRALMLAGIAMLSHLVLDDLSYWLGLVGLEKRSGPQIFWWYPFDHRLDEETTKFFKAYNEKPYTNWDIYLIYVSRLPRLFYLEIGLICLAVVVFLRRIYDNRGKRSS